MKGFIQYRTRMIENNINKSGPQHSKTLHAILMKT